MQVQRRWTNELKEKVANNYNVGISAVLFDNGQLTKLNLGSTSATAARPVSSETIFEVGSICKVITAVTAACAVRRGIVRSLDDEVAAVVPDVPFHRTFRQLANHTSGLPRLPPNFEPRDPSNPYQDFSEEHLLSCIRSHPPGPSGTYSYSNYGVGFLGHLISRLTRQSFSELCEEMVFRPLRMTSTHTRYTSIPADRRERIAQGHRNRTEPTSRWDFDALSGCGALLSTSDDLLTLMMAAMDAFSNGAVYTEVGKALRDSLAEPWAPIGSENAVALGWHIMSTKHFPVFWHNGGTYGFCSFAGFNPHKRRAVVILTNSDTRLDNIGNEVLLSNDPNFLLDDDAVLSD